MINLMKDKELYTKKSLVAILCGIILSLLTIPVLFLFTTGTKFSSLSWFIDLPSVILLVIPCLAIVLLSGVKGKKEILSVIQKALLPVGTFVFLFTIVIILGTLDDITTLGPNLAVAFLTLIYAFMAYIILIPIINRLKKG